MDSVSRLFAIIKHVPWDIEPAAGSSPGFVRGVCRLGGMRGMSWRGKCSPVQGWGGVELLNAVLSEGGMLGLTPVLQKRETGGEASWLASSCTK